MPISNPTRKLHRISHRANADSVACRIRYAKAVVNDIERVNGIGIATKVDGQVEQLTTWEGPPLVCCVVLSTLYTAIDTVREVTRYLTVGGIVSGEASTVLSIVPEGKPRIKYSDKLFTWSFWHDGFCVDDGTVWTYDSIAFVCQSLPMLLCERL